MIPRRDLVTGSVLGGLLGALTASNADAAPGSPAPAADASSDAIVKAIADLRGELQAQRAFPEIAAVRDAQKQYLRANGKLPDFIDVGADVWFNVHDWHVRWQQPMTLGRDALGRYTVVLLQTIVVLRADAASAFVGLPYDNR